MRLELCVALWGDGRIVAILGQAPELSDVAARKSRRGVILHRVRVAKQEEPAPSVSVRGSYSIHRAHLL